MVVDFLPPAPKQARRWGFSFVTAAVLALISGIVPPAAVAQQAVEKIEVLVNDEVISAYDVRQRLGLVLAATGGVNSDEEFARLREQVVRSMVDEMLQLQEAAEFEVEITAGEKEQAFARISQNFNQSPEQFSAFLISNGSSKESLLRQVEAELAWQTLVSGRLRSFITVGDEEVEQVLERLQNSAGQFEYLVSEIYLLVDLPSRRDEVRASAERLVAQIREGAPFQAVARQFSNAATAAVGGDMGWVTEGQLIEVLDSQLKNMTPSDVSDPISAGGGFYILNLRDRRRILSIDPLDMRLDLRQIAYVFDESTTRESIQQRLEELDVLYEEIEGCDQTAAFAERTNATQEFAVGEISLREMPAQLRTSLQDLEIGKSTAPVLTQNGVLLLVVCGRTEPEVNMPTFDAVLNRLEQQRLSMMARRYLRDLRRNAVVDYKD